MISICLNREIKTKEKKTFYFIQAEQQQQQKDSIIHGYAVKSVDIKNRLNRYVQCAFYTVVNAIVLHTYNVNDIILLLLLLPHFIFVCNFAWQ